MPKQVRPSDAEKVTVNLGHVDLGRIDLLVADGFFANRADFIRAAIRAQLGAQAGEVAALVERRELQVGLHDVTRRDLETLRAAGEVLHLRVVGLARLAADIPVDLARETIGSITVLGTLQARPDLRSALADRIL